MLFFISQDDCQKSLNFYKSMEETSADIEKSAYKQFDAVREHGIFRLQTEEHAKCIEIHDAFQCIVTCDDLKKYSLDEIRELQSKLSLIGSHGQSREHEVDNFLQVTFMHLHPNNCTRYECYKVVNTGNKLL